MAVSQERILERAMCAGPRARPSSLGRRAARDPPHRRRCARDAPRAALTKPVLCKRGLSECSALASARGGWSYGSLHAALACTGSGCACALRCCQSRPGPGRGAQVRLEDADTLALHRVLPRGDRQLALDTSCEQPWPNTRPDETDLQSLARANSKGCRRRLSGCGWQVARPCIGLCL
eukprot:2443622-Rhodomonas_salina.3